MAQIFNFNAGPSMLPTDVLNQAQQEFCNWNGLGISIMEISHRDKKFIQLTEEIEKDLRDLLTIPSTYKVLFCHGGGRGQFSALPLNLLGGKSKADYIDTGYWSRNAMKEAKKYCTPNLIDVKMTINGKRGIKPMREWKPSYGSAYMHYCLNETIDGITVYEAPNFDEKIVISADFSSIILSTPIDIGKFGVIYAGAQKNIGPSGLTLVIVREDLLNKVSNTCPSILNYTLLSKKNSMFNTPPTFAWYLSGLVFKWLKKKGGVLAIDSINQQKSDLLYSVIDNSDFYHNDIFESNRSRMNIPFQLIDNRLENLFLEKSFSAGLLALKGHRSVGGMRASIYNAMPIEGVKILADFMIDFERRYG